MFGHALRRALAASVATAGVFSLAVVGSTSPAVAAACDPGYAGAASTVTSLKLAHSIGEYGDSNSATVRVSSGADGTPKGKVTISVDGHTYSVSLSGGRASHSLPSNLGAQSTYTVKAKYAGSDCFKSSGASKFYTVTKAGTHVRGLAAASIRRGQHPHVTGRVATTDGSTAKGRVTVSLFHDGDLKKRETVSLSGGRFSATFGKVFKRGAWSATATAVPTANYRGSSASDGFRVR